ncbi:MAG: DUF1214 domain-containing protein [Steroidobacteraceae bacterium]
MVNRFTRAALLALSLLSGPARSADTGWSAEQQRYFGQSVTDLSRSVGMLGYLYCMPFFEFAVAEMRQVKGVAKDNSAPHGMFGYFNGGRLSDHTTTWFGVPNPDVLYSSAWLYVKDSPYVLYVPPMDDIWYSVQFENYYSVDEAYISSRTIGHKGGYFLITYQDWNEPLPPGIQGHVRLTTPTTWILTRIEATRDNEKERHERYERKFRLIDLASYLKDPVNARLLPQTPQKNVPPIIAASYDIRETLDFFAVVNHHLRQIEAPEQDKGLMALFDAAGFGPNVVFDPQKLPRQTVVGLEQSIKDGFNFLHTMRARPMSGNSGGWSTAPRRLGTFGQDYILRALSVFGGLGANIPEEAVYPNAYSDSEGHLLSGDHEYTITFPKGQTPPAQAFWSITLMDSTTHFMVDNPIHRNHIGSNTRGLRDNPDGSLTIVVSPTEPGDPVLRANWLPSRQGMGIHLIMRIYQPRQVAIDGQYMPPPILRVK